MNESSDPNRRRFLAQSAVAAAAALTVPPVISDSELSGAIPLVGEQIRGFAISSSGVIAVAKDRQVELLDVAGKQLQIHELDFPVRAVAFDNKDVLHVALKDRIGRIESCCAEFIPTRLGRDAVITSFAPVDDNSVFVADSGNKVIWKINGDGDVLARITPHKREFKVSKAFFPIHWTGESLLVSETGRHRVHEFDLHGKSIRTWGSKSRRADGFSGCCNPVGLTSHSKGRVLTAERGLNRFKIYNPDGSLHRELANPVSNASKTEKSDKGEKELFGCESGGLDIAVDAQDHIWVLDRQDRTIRRLV